MVGINLISATWFTLSVMAACSECVASSVVGDKETLDQIRLENAEFYGALSSEEEDHLGEEDHSAVDANDTVDEELSLSEDEASTRREITSMSVPSGAAGPGTSSADQEEEKVATEFEKGCGCDKLCYEQFS